MIKKLALLFSCIFLILFAACGKDKVNTDPTGTTATSESEYYEEGITLLKKNKEKGRLVLKQVIQLYPTSVYAQKAKIAIADSYMKKNDPSSLIMAISEYQEYLGLYPNSPDAIYAKYQIGMCYFYQMKKPGRDQTNTMAAIKAFESLIRQYPETKEAEMAQQNITKAKHTAAEHVFLIGRTNYLIKAYKGAIARFKEVMDQYPDYKGMDELIYLTAESYSGSGDKDTARSFYQQLVDRSPEGKFGKKAKRKLEKLMQETSEKK